jgi:hypothetical protein
MALLAVLVVERSRAARRLVCLPPEGATLHEIERAALVAALDRTGWVQASAAKLLGMTARAFNYRMSVYRLYEENPLGRTEKRVYANRDRTTARSHARVAGRDWRQNVGTF